jgi:hypothetical protein
MRTPQRGLTLQDSPPAGYPNAALNSRISFVWHGLPWGLSVASLILLAGCSSPPERRATSPVPVPSIKAQATVVRGPTGPTLPLDYGRGASSGSPIAEFMYFVPLISPDPVSVTESPGNTQRGRIVAATRRFKSDSFSVVSAFEITGEGSQYNTFDPTNHIRRNEQRLKEGAVLERQLDSIVVSGAGRGRIEVEGVVSNGAPVVTEVRLRFNDGRPSPVTIGLHDIRFADGAVRFDNETIARVNTLTFRRSTGRPKMEVTVASVRRKDAGAGLWQKFVGSVTATAANLFLKPITVDRTGHEAMLNFGAALATAEPRFTFPRAKNLKNGPATVP